MNTGTNYRIDESTGAQIRCNSFGKAIKPSNPRVIGRFNYDERKEYKTMTKTDLSEIELPQTMKMPFRRVYAPQLQRLNGYSQLPRMIAPAYQNSKFAVTTDPIQLKRAQRTNSTMLRIKNASLTQA